MTSTVAFTEEAEFDLKDAASLTPCIFGSKLTASLSLDASIAIEAQDPGNGGNDEIESEWPVFGGLAEVNVLAKAAIDDRHVILRKALVNSDC